MEIKFRSARLNHRSAGGQSPAAWRMRNDSAVSVQFRLTGPLRSGPPLGFDPTVRNGGAGSLAAIARRHLKVVAFVAAPRSQVDFKLGRCACNGDHVARTCFAQSPFYQKVPTLRKPENAK